MMTLITMINAPVGAVIGFAVLLMLLKPAIDKLDSYFKDKGWP